VKEISAIMGSAEKFCLRWNDFESNISSAFKELREDKDFFDVTLACEDSDQLQAHKVILSACSPFFRTLLRRVRHDHPLLYLKGVKYLDLVAVLNFMYHGEVNVAQEELNSFLAVAEDLKVKGLTQGGGGSGSADSKRGRSPPAAPPPSSSKTSSSLSSAGSSLGAKQVRQREQQQVDHNRGDVDTGGGGPPLPKRSRPSQPVSATTNSKALVGAWFDNIYW
jgi:BTB/POZ domain